MGHIFLAKDLDTMSKSQKGKDNPMYGRKHTRESIGQMSEMKKGKNNPMYGKHHTEKSKTKMRVPRSEETKEKLRQTKLGEKNPNFGKHLSKETRQKMSDGRSGEKKGRWLDGISFEPYGLDFNNKFKEAIRARDNYCCVICNKMQEELNRKLDIHHVDYIKRNNFLQNCVSLCRTHHSETNCNRQSWTKFFQSLLKERYGYEYTEDQKIILDFTKEA